MSTTYKINAHKLSLVNIAGNSSFSSTKRNENLQTFAIATAFVSSKAKLLVGGISGKEYDLCRLQVRQDFIAVVSSHDKKAISNFEQAISTLKKIEE